MAAAGGSGKESEPKMSEADGLRMFDAAMQRGTVEMTADVRPKSTSLPTVLKRVFILFNYCLQSEKMQGLRANYLAFH